MKSAPNARARFSCGKENNCLSEGLYTKERFCYDKENQQLQTKMSTENPGQTVVECGKAAGYIKMVGKKMYRVSKVLNNNGIIAINMEENQEYVLLGKGVGFGKKVSQRFEAPADCTIYRLAQETERGSAKELAKSIAPEFLEIADEILREAEKTFGDTIDRRILFPLADHISFAVGRIRNPTGSRRMSVRAWAKAWVKSWILLKLVILPCILRGQWSSKHKWLSSLRDLHNKFNGFFDSSTHGSTAVCD